MQKLRINKHLKSGLLFVVKMKDQLSVYETGSRPGPIHRPF